MRSVLITGCNRGIGLSMVKQLINLPYKQNIIATCRNPAKAIELKEIAANNNNVHIIEIDVKDFEKYDDMAKQVESIVGDNGLNVLINNAGISTKFTRISLLKVEHMTENFIVNTVAPLMLVKAHLPLIKKASEKNNNTPMGVQRAAIINISSVLGSIISNNQGGFYPYRCSKAALNAATKSLSLDLKKDEILVVSVHPGWLKTDLGGKNAPLDVDVTVAKMLNLFGTLNEKHNGKFIQYDGESLPW